MERTPSMASVPRHSAATDVAPARARHERPSRSQPPEVPAARQPLDPPPRDPRPRDSPPFDSRPPDLRSPRFEAVGGSRRRGASSRGVRRAAWAALAGAIVAWAGTQFVLGESVREPAATAVTSPAPPEQAPVVALAGLTGPPTLYGKVIDVPDPGTAVVEVGQRAISVSVIGVDTGGVPDCAREDATAFARGMLAGRLVTLVPDPTLTLDPNAPAWPAYLVLPTQQSYTDAAIVAGWVGAGQGRYRPGFLAEEQQARDDDAGMWGPPCNRSAPN